MSLKTYQKKRKFSGVGKTTEPSPKISKGKNKDKKKKTIFVVHHHEASHLHWDLRLEIKGVLASWAVPKEPPKKKGIKRLAIHVEDHPLSYAGFEGEIPEGNYGAGKVEIWDEGNYELKNKDKKKIEFTLYGKKLKGDYVLVKTNYGAKPEKSWIWFKV